MSGPLNDWGTKRSSHAERQTPELDLSRFGVQEERDIAPAKQLLEERLSGALLVRGIWLSSDAVEESTQDKRAHAGAGLFRVMPLSQWRAASELLSDHSELNANYSELMNNYSLAASLGALVGGFAAEQRGAEAARAIARLDETILPIVASIILSQSADSWPEEQVLPLLQGHNSALRTEMLCDLAVRCNLPHVRVPAILTIAERDLGRACGLKTELWSGMDDGTREWLQEELDFVQLSAKQQSYRATHRTASLDDLRNLSLPRPEMIDPKSARLGLSPDEFRSFRSAVFGGVVRGMAQALDVEAFVENIRGLKRRSIITEDTSSIIREVVAALEVDPKRHGLQAYVRRETESGDLVARAREEAD